MKFDADLHFHGLYSGGVSKNMLLPVIAEQAKLKGLHIVATSDALHGKWLEHCEKELVEETNGVFIHRNFETHFIISTEVETNDSVHHLLYFPDFSAAKNLKENLEGKANFDSMGCGRPRIRVNSEEIAEHAFDAGAIIGPAHGFTPYFSIYAHHNSMQECYGAMKEKITFMELGLSADTHYADMIADNHNFVFLTNSDSHSPWPYRIGREFMRIEMKKPNFSELKNAFEKKDEKKVVLNVGLNPKEGKYHCTACSNCFAKYSMTDAEKYKWRCVKCRSAIKKGVKDRILELADSGRKETHPSFRPPYLHSIPLAEIIQIALEVKGVNTQRVQVLWREFVDQFKSEIKILVDVEISELAEVDSRTAEKINAFRNNWVHYIPGGGGNYGTPIICSSETEFEKKKKELGEKLECGSETGGQKSLGEF